MGLFDLFVLFWNLFCLRQQRLWHLLWCCVELSLYSRELEVKFSLCVSFGGDFKAVLNYFWLPWYAYLSSSYGYHISTHIPKVAHIFNRKKARWESNWNLLSHPSNARPISTHIIVLVWSIHSWEKIFGSCWQLSSPTTCLLELSINPHWAGSVHPLLLAARCTIKVSSF